MILEAKNVHKWYNHSGSKLHVLNGIDLAIKEKEVLCIVGPSGAGKSTLLHILGGLDYPNEGSVELDNQDFYGLKDNARADIRNQKIGFVFQFYHLLSEFTALENVLLPAFIREKKKKGKHLEKKALALLERVGLEARSQHKPYQLSGGEQQRVAIARALINDPEIIFCDEPTGNLDSQLGNEIIDLLMELNKENNQTLVIVTHAEEIARRSHRVVHIRDGKLT